MLCQFYEFIRTLFISSVLNDYRTSPFGPSMCSKRHWIFFLPTEEWIQKFIAKRDLQKGSLALVLNKVKQLPVGIKELSELSDLLRFCPQEQRDQIPTIWSKGGIEGVKRQLQDWYNQMPKHEKMESVKFGVVLQAVDFSEIVQRRNVEDAEVIVQEFERRGIRTLSNEQIRAAVNNFVSHLELAVEKEIKFFFQNNIRDAVTEAIQKDYGEKFKPYLEVQPNDESRFLLLVNLSKNKNDKFFSNRLTPYYARMILLFALAGKMNNTERVQLAKRLQLKFDIRTMQVRPLKEEALGEVPWEKLLFHDGYVFGASRKDSKLLYTSSSPKLSMGTDCSITFQLAYEAVGYTPRLFGVRLTTDNMNPGKEGLFQVTPLCSEKDLEYGDGILQEGHIRLFVGYNNTKERQLMIVEAAGGNSRDVHHKPFEVYKPDTQCQNSPWIQWFLTKDGKTYDYYRRVRPVELPR